MVLIYLKDEKRNYFIFQATRQNEDPDAPGVRPQ